MLTPAAHGGLMPDDYLDLLDQFDKLIVWKRIVGTDKEIPEPQEGLDANFDAANDKVNSIKAELDAYLETIKQKLGFKKINYVNIKFIYELEIPVELVKGNKKPKEFELTSNKAGYERFHTNEIKAMVDRLEDAEEALKSEMVPFLCAIFSRFHE